MTTNDTPARIAIRLDFIALLHDLRRSLREQPEVWENDNLDSFLESLAAWTADMDVF